MANNEVPCKFKNTFSRRIGRALRLSQKDLINNFLPSITISSTDELERIKQEYKKVRLEIGIGNGEFFLQNAIRNPDILFIGCEPYLNCVAAVLAKIKHHNLSNVRIFADDARIILKLSPDYYFDSIYIICPDPWPRRKQHDRRLINESLLNLLDTKTASSGNVTIVTDHRDYAQWILTALINVSHFTLHSNNVEEYKSLPDDWIYTKYQRKGLAQEHNIYYFSLDKQGYSKS